MKLSKASLLTYLKTILFLVLGIVVVGGVTRLTDSGLSMVDWHPVYGILPPLTESAWQSLFLEYQQYPDYLLKQSHLDLKGFKFIFFWEYIHRMMGRLIGLCALLPLIYFWIKGQRKWMSRLFVIPVLVGIQGLIGWWMVKSGLIHQPSVSHIRLAIHLLMAFFIASYTYWQYLVIRFERVAKINPLARLSRFFVMALSLQILYGVLLAGLDGGYAFPTWPKMGESWVPNSIFMIEGIRNVVDNPFMLQFIHRWLPFLILLLLLWIFYRSSAQVKVALKRILILYFLQISLGIGTLITGVQISLAVLHQFVGLLLLLSAVRLLYVTHYDEPGA